MVGDSRRKLIYRYHPESPGHSRGRRGAVLAVASLHRKTRTPGLLRDHIMVLRNRTTAARLNACRACGTMIQMGHSRAQKTRLEPQERLA